MNFEFSRQSFEKYSNTNFARKSFQWEQKCAKWAGGPTDGRDQAKSRFSQCCA